MSRTEFTFEPYEVMGYDAEWDTWGFHGTEVYHNGHYLGILPWIDPSDIDAMDDDELERNFDEFGIII